MKRSVQNAVTVESNDLVKEWFVLHTASNNEKQVERHLQRRQFQTFLPLYTVNNRWKNRTTAKVQFPLFPGYVFARFARPESWRVLDIPMVYSIVGNKRGSLSIPESEINGLREGLAAAKPEPHPFINVGSRARIKSGALAGWEGIVLRVDGGLRVVLTVESIERSFAVSVTAESIDLLD